MIQKLKEYDHWNTMLLLLIMSLICFSLSVFRSFYSGTKTFLFLNWNLFLAFIPWAFTTLYSINKRLHNKKLFTFLLLVIWLLFFPNAPYILTDLFHLRLQTNMPIWFDLVLIIAFAWTGLLFGFISLFEIEKQLKQYFPQKAIVVISTLLLFLSSFGIYLGRYLRWNSWDIVSDPVSLLADVGSRFINPMAHPRTWGMTLAMGLLLNMIYWSIKVIRSEKST